MYDLKNDISSLTGVNTKSIVNITSKIELCIADYVMRCIDSGSSECCIDLGFGTLKILIGEDNLRYLFEPSTRLEKTLITSIETGENILVQKLSESVSDKLIKMYKEIL